MNAPDPRAGPVPAWLGRALEPVYRRAVARRNARFDRGEGVRRFNLPVISVGNLSVGGTGKTPMVARVVGTLLEWSRTPAIVMRGYKRPRGGGGAAMSDEQAEYADRFGTRVPVLADPDRCRSIAALERERRADVVVMDDGFQHRRVARDLDIVLLDATRDVFADALLPRGWLREPVSSLARAGVVVLTRSDAADEQARHSAQSTVAALAPHAAWCEASHQWAGLRVFEAGTAREEAAEWMAATPLLLACGIGNPGAFERQCLGAGAHLVDRFIRPDHHHWNAADVREIERSARRHQARGVVTTMKDWVKLREIPAAAGLTWCVPRVDMTVVAGAGQFDAALRRALEAGRRPPVQH